MTNANRVIQRKTITFENNAMKAGDYRHRESKMRMQLVAARPRPLTKKRPAYREKLIHEHLPNVKLIVQRIASHLPAGVDVEDLMNVGVMGLMEDPVRLFGICGGNDLTAKTEGFRDCLMKPISFPVLFQAAQAGFTPHNCF